MDRHRISIRRPVAVAMVFLAAVVFGVKSYQELALNLMPDLSYPTLTIRAEYEEAAPEEVENYVSRPLEEALSTVNNLVEIRSVSSAGLSQVMLEFQWGTDMDLVALDAREKMDRVFLPEEVGRPRILRYNPSLDPILRLGVYGDYDLFELRRIAEKELKPRVEGLPGVASVKVKGGLEQEILVEVDEGRLAQLEISMEQITQRLKQENINLAGGSLKEGSAEYLVRTLNEFVELGDIGEIVIGRKGQGSKGQGRRGQSGAAGPAGVGRLLTAGSLGTEGVEVRLRDAATIRWSHKKRDIITRINGKDSVEVEFFKEAGSNTVKVADRIKAALNLLGEADPGGEDSPSEGFMAELARDYPGVQVKLISDPARFIKRALEEVRTTAVFGGFLALCILFLFLRDAKSTLIIGVSLPVSILATFLPMFVFDVSLNLMSLGGLALGIGMLVDNSIVVLESIFRCREEGDDVVGGADRGTGEVASAITSSTLTTVAVFFPIVFVKGIAGQVFRDLALTVTFSLVGSLLVALYLIPMLASRKVRSKEAGGDRAGGTESFAGLSRGSLSGARQWVSDNARPGRWVREARGYLKGEPVVPTSVDDRDAAHAPAPDARARPGALGRCLMAVYGLAHVPLEALRLVLGVTFGLTFGVAWFLILLAVRLVVPVVRAVSRLVMALLNPLLAGLEALMGATVERYPIMLRWALRHRMLVLGAAGLLFIHCVSLLPRLGNELIPQIHQGQFSIIAEKAVGTPLEDTSQAVIPLEARALEDKRVEAVSCTVGSEASGEEAIAEQKGEHSAEITVTLRDIGGNVYQEEDLMDELREAYKDLVGIRIKFEMPSLFSFKTPVEVEIEGNDLATLRRLSAEVEQKMRGIEGLEDIRASARVGNPEVRIQFDRDRLARFGMDAMQAASVVQLKLLGDIPTRLSDGEDRFDIRVRADRKHMERLEDLRSMKIELPGGRFLPLSAIARMKIVPGPSEVRRIGQRRVAVISANLKDRDLGSVSREIMESLRDLNPPAGYGVSLGGQDREMQASFESLWLAMALAVFLVYIVMASQFESLLQPFVILFSIPLGLIGVVYALTWFKIPLSVVVFMGAIMLVGIVVNNAIVLVDYVNVLRRRGVSPQDALVQAGQIRLRPILMTTATTVLGLTPMALGLGEGAEIRVPMAVTVIAGLVCSTVLTLFVIPIVYSFVGRGR